jgi:uncharacterized protein DUF6968
MLIGNSQLTLQDGNDKINIPVRLFAPRIDAAGAWGCRYEIDWPDKMSAKEIFGADSMQAIVLALQMIGFEIYHSEFHETGLLYSEKRGGGYGFPMMNAYRDLLQGDDAKYL